MSVARIVEILFRTFSWGSMVLKLIAEPPVPGFSTSQSTCTHRFLIWHSTWRSLAPSCIIGNSPRIQGVHQQNFLVTWHEEIFMKKSRFTDSQIWRFWRKPTREYLFRICAESTEWVAPAFTNSGLSSAVRTLRWYPDFRTGRWEHTLEENVCRGVTFVYLIS